MRSRSTSPTLDGLTLHAPTRAHSLDVAGREALLRYAPAPPIAQARIELHRCGLVRIAIKRAYAIGNVAVDMAPLSLLRRLATSVPPPPFHTFKYSGVLASASPWRPRIGPQPPTTDDTAKAAEAAQARRRAPLGRPSRAKTAARFSCSAETSAPDP